MSAPIFLESHRYWGVVARGRKTAECWLPTRERAEKYRAIFHSGQGDAKIITRQWWYCPDGSEWDAERQRLVARPIGHELDA
jgi:hypothetical protein